MIFMLLNFPLDTLKLINSHFAPNCFFFLKKKKPSNQALKFVYQLYFICDYILYSNWIKRYIFKSGKIFNKY